MRKGCWCIAILMVFLCGCGLPPAPEAPEALPRQCRVLFQLSVYEDQNLVTSQQFVFMQQERGFYFSGGKGEEYLFLKEEGGYGFYNREEPGGEFFRSDIPPLSQEAVARFQSEFLPLNLLFQDCTGLTAVRRGAMAGREGTVYEGKLAGEEVSCLLDDETGLALALSRTSRTEGQPAVRYLLTCQALEVRYVALPSGEEQPPQAM